jgi:hypothetical protein
MTGPSLHQLEQEAEAARGRLARNLRTLRSPTARQEFTDAIKQEAVAARDDVVDRTRTAVQTRIGDWIDDLKARAAENPVAVLAIAAGIGWRFLRDPPISTALVGIGMFSLLRGGAPSVTGLDDRDYVDRAVGTLKQQSRQVAAEVADRAGVAAAVAGEKVREWSDEAVATARETGARALDTAAGAAANASDSLHASLQASEDAVARAATGVGQAAADMQRTVRNQSGRLAGDLADRATAGAAQVGHAVEGWSTQAAAAMQPGRTGATDDTAAADASNQGWRPVAAGQEAGAMMSGRDVPVRSDTANQLLLGAAGAAVAAALGVALQRRMAETEPSD